MSFGYLISFNDLKSVIVLVENMSQVTPSRHQTTHGGQELNLLSRGCWKFLLSKGPGSHLRRWLKGNIHLGWVLVNPVQKMVSQMSQYPHSPGAVG